MTELELRLLLERQRQEIELFGLLLREIGYLAGAEPVERFRPRLDFRRFQRAADWLSLEQLERSGV